MSLAGKVALVTGAGSPTGIGFATGRLLAQQGARVAITSTTIQDRAKELAAEGFDVLAKTADLTSREEAQALVDAVLRHYGRIDILVDNAGMIQVDGSNTSASFGRAVGLGNRDQPENDVQRHKDRVGGHACGWVWADRECLICHRAGGE